MSHDHEPDHTRESPAPAPTTPDDAGSQALAEALHSSFTIVKVVMALMVLAFFSSGFFTVGPQEKAVILRFGRPVGEGEKVLLNSGWHWSYPYPIDEVVKIPITEIQKVNSTVGWYATTAEQELSGEELPASVSLNPAVDGYAITADRNIIHTRATLYYHIDNPIHFVFDFVSASNTVQNALNNALLYTAAHFNVDDVLTRDVAGFRDAVLQRVSDLTEQEQLGIVIDQCEVQSIPPRQLQDVFTRVTTARENRNKDPQRRAQLRKSGPQPGRSPGLIHHQCRRRRPRALRPIHHRRGETLQRFAAEIRKQSKPVRAGDPRAGDGADPDQCAGQNLFARARRRQTARTAIDVES